MGAPMIDGTLTTADSVRLEIAAHGFARISPPLMRVLLAAAGPLADWDRFAASWNNLATDTYMADGGRYRRRRHGVYVGLADGSIARAPHQPHYQAREYNSLNGGIPRWFEPIDAPLGDGPTMTSILRFCHGLFDALTPGVPRWHVEAHQFRIEARAGEQGRPTPEGVHRDGVDYVLVMLIARENVVSGTTTVHDADGRPFGSFTLTHPFEAIALDDSRVAHGVTPIEPLDPARPAYRDVLVVTWARRQ
jgi:hypothetical protein